MKQRWKFVPGFDDFYEVSDYGRVRSFKGKEIRILKQLKDGHGYFGVTLSKPGFQKRYLVGSLVAKAFVSGHFKNAVCHHRDENIENNRFYNLEWITQRENATLGQIKNKKLPVGVRVKNGKFRVFIRFQEKQWFLGTYETVCEADKVYQKALKSINKGEFNPHERKIIRRHGHMKKTKGVITQGWDMGLNHCGFVELLDGELSNFWYLTNMVGSVKKSKKHGFRLILSKSKDKQIMSVERLAFIRKFIRKKVIKKRPDFIGIESYALRAERGAHQLGEIGSVARLICWYAGIPFRLHDPISVKMFATHDGTCQKDLVEEVVLERWGHDFGKYNQPAAKPTIKRPDPKQNRTTSEDLSDACAIAQLVWTEVQLRNGLIMMSDLHPKEIQVFNRITKSYPISLLSREWIQKVA